MAILDYVILTILLFLSAMFSGLTLGLMSLDVFTLKRRVKLNNKDAIKVYPLRKKGNLLLCTLLLGNVAVNSTLAIFLGSITAGVIAGIVATSLIVIFGEIIPQSLFSRHALKLGAKSTWLVWIFLFLLYPISKPLAMVLDKFLGGELPTIFSKKEFRLFIREQRKLKKSDLAELEFSILEKGLVFSSKCVKSIMTPRINVFFISKKAKLNKTLINKIHSKGHSRMPVFDKTRDRVVGMLYSKDLITLDPKDKISITKVMRKSVHYINENRKLGQVLSLFKKRKIHLFIVRNKFKGVVGIISLEDVLEEIVGEIIDEYDKIKDMRTID
jgi:metal transporter CNNM